MPYHRSLDATAEEVLPSLPPSEEEILQMEVAFLTINRSEPGNLKKIDETVEDQLIMKNTIIVIILLFFLIIE